MVRASKKRKKHALVSLGVQEAIRVVVDGGPSVLDMSKVLFIKSVDPLDREKVGHLLEIDEGLAAD